MRLVTPKIDVDQYTGTAAQIADQLVSTANTLVDTLVAPLKAIKGTVDAAYGMTDTAAIAAKAAQVAARVGLPGQVASLTKKLEQIEFQRAKIEKLKDTIDNSMDVVLDRAAEIQKICDEQSKHSAKWVSDKINQELEWMTNYVQGVLDKVTAKLEAIQKKVEDRINAEKEKAEARAQKMADDMQEQLKNNQQRALDKKNKNTQLSKSM